MEEEPEFKNKHARRAWYLERGLCPKGCGPMVKLDRFTEDGQLIKARTMGCETCGTSAAVV